MCEDDSEDASSGSSMAGDDDDDAASELDIVIDDIGGDDGGVAAAAEDDVGVEWWRALVADEGLDVKAISTGQSIGRLHTNINSCSIRATCKQKRDKCFCWLSLANCPPRFGKDAKEKMAAGRAHVLEWLARGLDASPAEHYRQGQALKKNFGMKVKG